MLPRVIRGLRAFLRAYSTQEPPMMRIRNVGIIAHIDAGKTTTTERMLFYTGSIKRIGDVDDGDTITDYLQAERDRGITIQSAAVTVPWHNHKINIIDTPGHADFTFEVIRSLRVLDGTVTILDAVAGVEAQTEKVWRQAKALGLPTVVYVNKMDREGSGFGRTCREIVLKLGTRIALVNIPYFKQDEAGDRVFSGVVDVVNKLLLQWDLINDPDGLKVEVVDLEKHASKYPQQVQELEKSRESLIETLCDFDDALVDEFLEAEENYMAISGASIKRALRKATLENGVSPVLCGASFKNIGVQPLLDAVVDFLPNPNEAPEPEVKIVNTRKNLKSKAVIGKSKKDPVSGLILNNNPNFSVGLAFKVITDPRKVPMVFVRVYAGRIQNGSTLLNTRTGKKFRVTNLFLINGDHTHKIEKLTCGNIGVVTVSLLSSTTENTSSDTPDDANAYNSNANPRFDDVNEVRTGDTLVAHTIKKDGTKSLNATETSIGLNPIEVPPSIFITSLEPRTISDKKALDENLRIILREDPSLRVFENEEGQTLLSGMGELHLEIVKDRLIYDLKTKCEVSKVMVTYKETLLTATKVFKKQLESSGEQDSFEVLLKIEPWDGPIESHPLFTELGEKDAERDLFVLPTDNNLLYIPLIAGAPAVQKHIKTHGNHRKLQNSATNSSVHLDFWPLAVSYDQVCSVISSAAIGCLQSGGPWASLPLHSVVVKIEKWRMPKASTDLKTMLQITRECINEALQSLDSEKDYAVLEPIMKIQVFTSNESIGRVTHDLTSARKAEIFSIDDENTSEISSQSHDFLKEAENQYVPYDPTMGSADIGAKDRGGKVITALAPLKEMIGYLSRLRSLTKGRGTFLMEYHGLRRVTKDRLQTIREEI